MILCRESSHNSGDRGNIVKDGVVHGSILRLNNKEVKRLANGENEGYKED
jgi:hypothetical protein